MEYAIIYSSKSGNTAMLAEAIKTQFSAHNCTYCGAPSLEIELPNIVFIGFWTNRGSCDEACANFVTTLKNKKIVLFGTAGFGGSNTYFAQILDTVKEIIPIENKIIGAFMCQGKMGESVKSRYESILAENPQDNRTKELLENYYEALIHPDSTDLSNMQLFADKVSALL